MPPGFLAPVNHPWNTSSYLHFRVSAGDYTGDYTNGSSHLRLHTINHNFDYFSCADLDVGTLTDKVSALGGSIARG